MIRSPTVFQANFQGGHKRRWEGVDVYAFYKIKCVCVCICVCVKEISVCERTCVLKFNFFKPPLSYAPTLLKKVEQE